MLRGHNYWRSKTERAATYIAMYKTKIPSKSLAHLYSDLAITCLDKPNLTLKIYQKLQRKAGPGQ